MEIEWQVEDGYAGGSRPQEFEIPDDEILECDDAAEAMDLIHSSVEDDFGNKVSWCGVSEGL